MRGSKTGEWPLFISYRRGEVTEKAAGWLKEELEREAIESDGRSFRLNVFLDVAEPHRPNFQATLRPHLEQSRALIVLADHAAVVKRVGERDYLHDELTWWATERRTDRPIILQLDRASGKALVEDPQYQRWSAVNRLNFFWEQWASESDGGQAHRDRLLANLRHSIRDYGRIVHLREVRRLRRRALVATSLGVAALIAAVFALNQTRNANNERKEAIKLGEIAEIEATAASLAAAQSAAASADDASARAWLARIRPEHRGWEWRYLNAQIDGSSLTLRQSDDFVGPRILMKDTYLAASERPAPIAIVTFSADGRELAAKTRRDEIVVWDTASGKRLHVLRTGLGYVACIALDPSKQQIAVGGLDGTLRIHDLESESVTEFPAQQGVVSAVLYSSEDTLVSASWDGAVISWNMQTQAVISRFVFPDAAEQIQALAWSRGPFGGKAILKLTDGASPVKSGLAPVKHSVVRASLGRGGVVWAELDDGGIFKVDLAAGRADPVADRTSRLFTRPPGVALAFEDPGGKRAVKLWELEPPERSWDLRGLGTGNIPAAISPDRAALAVVAGATLRVYRTADLALARTLVGHDLPIKVVVYSPDGQRIATGSDDGEVKLWDVAAALPASVAAHRSAVTALQFCDVAGEPALISASDDGSVLLHPWTRGASPRELFRDAKPIAAIAISPDGGRLAIARQEEDAALVDLRSGAPPAYVTGHRASAVAFSRDGSRIIVAEPARDEDERFRVIDALTGQEDPREPPATTRRYVRIQASGTVTAISSRSSEEFAWVSRGGRAGIGDARTGKPLHSLPGDSALAITGDGRLIAAGSGGGEIQLFEVSRRERRALRGNTVAVHGLAFSPDGHRLISGAEDGTLRVWDVERARELLSLHTGAAIRSVAFSADGETVASGHADGTIRFWRGR